MEEKMAGKPKKGIIICRVSTSEQARKGTSLESQEISGKHRATELNVEIVKVIRINISGERFAKENYEFILKLVEEMAITHLFVYSFDRLSRSFPYGVMLVQSLWDRNVKIVTSTFTANSDRSNDRLQVWLSLLFAEMEHKSIHERTKRGMTMKLTSGIYPLVWLPFGYERIDLKIQLKSEYKPVIRFIFDIFIQVKCYNEAARHANEKYGKEMDFVLKGREIRKIVGDKIYLGYLSWGGMVFGEGDENESRKELVAIDEKTFDMAQVVVERIARRYSRAGSSPVEKLVDEYGVEATVDAYNLKVSCPKCGSIETQKNGKEKLRDMLQLKYICVKCDHHFRFPSVRQHKRIKNLISDPCRNCGSKDRFILEKDNPILWKLRCNNCNHVIFLREHCDQHTAVRFPRIERKSKKKMKYDEKQIQLI